MYTRPKKKQAMTLGTISGPSITNASRYPTDGGGVGNGLLGAVVVPAPSGPL